MVDLCPVVKWSDIQIVFWKPDWKSLFMVQHVQYSIRQVMCNYHLNTDTHIMRYSGVRYSDGLLYWNGWNFLVRIKLCLSVTQIILRTLSVPMIRNSRVSMYRYQNNRLRVYFLNSLANHVTPDEDVRFWNGMSIGILDIKTSSIRLFPVFECSLFVFIWRDIIHIFVKMLQGWM